MSIPDPVFPERDGVRHAVRVIAQGVPRHALVDGERLALLDAAPWDGGHRDGSTIARANARYLVPCVPGKIVCIGVNYADHAKESVSVSALPDEPVLFMKPPSALLPHGGTIFLPAGVGRVDHESEMAIVIGRRTVRAGVEEARAAIAGVTAVNDVSARVLQKKDGQFTRAKGFDTFCPLGPSVALGLDPDDLGVIARVNGTVRQDSRTKHLHVGAVDLVVFISNVMTLEPGDVISTGTPAGVAPLEPGDTVSIEIEGLGPLVNDVRERPGVNVVVTGARVRTLDAARPLATVLAAASGRIAYVGDDLAAARSLSPGAEVIDLRGRTLTPGLADSHTHVTTWARTRERLSLDGLTALEPVLARVREAHARLPAGEPLLGEEVAPFGVFAPAPSRAQLDLAAPGRRVVLRGRDLHAAWASSAALAHAGITRRTDDPPGGRIGRDEAGEPDGLLFENALGLLDLGGELAQGVLERALHQAAALGLTCVHEFGDAQGFVAYRALAEAGRLPLRVAYGVMPSRGRTEEPLQATDDPRAWVFAHKAFVDGTLGSRTAWMLEPFEGSGDTGLPTLDAAALDRLGERARVHGVTLALHAIGDAAVRAALDAFERWPAGERIRLRPRIEHAQLVHPDDFGRFKALGVIASMQPAHSMSDRALARALWGERDRRGGYAWRGLEDAGAVLAFGSDAPIEPIDPRVGLWAATTGGSERALPFERALHGFTTGAAFAVRREHELGQLTRGFLADFTVWSEDPWEAPPERLREVAIEQTWVDGRRVV